MPVSGQSVAQRIPVVGRHADPGGNPSASQSASFWHSEQTATPSWAQKLLFAVVLKQKQVAEPLHGATVGTLEQSPGNS
jgi:hypothetical protein